MALLINRLEDLLGKSVNESALKGQYSVIKSAG